MFVRNRKKLKGIEVEYFFFIFGLIFAVMILGLWQQMGFSLATERMSELKINTVYQIKNILLLMQIAPVETYTCASLKNCNQISIHSNYIGIWGPANDYFEEGNYLSDSLIGNMELYSKDDSGDWVLVGDTPYTTACGSGNQVLFVCFKKIDERVIYISKLVGVGR
ncbi:MAG: hypothetical protein KAT28_05565 [Candidatus Aenigmarchaeota archaeon]|nr:hypothetical protein [Candidatus Aenigmarchaeota archaeon]